jgi:hypothetical protein
VSNWDFFPDKATKIFLTIVEVLFDKDLEGLLVEGIDVCGVL